MRCCCRCCANVAPAAGLVDVLFVDVAAVVFDVVVDVCVDDGDDGVARVIAAVVVVNGGRGSCVAVVDVAVGVGIDVCVVNVVCVDAAVATVVVGGVGVAGGDVVVASVGATVVALDGVIAEEYVCVVATGVVPRLPPSPELSMYCVLASPLLFVMFVVSNCADENDDDDDDDDGGGRWRWGCPCSCCRYCG